jgi:hypothetical protein
LDIRITEGRAMSPPPDGMGTPVIQRMGLHSGATLVVSHPQPCSFEHFQGQDNLKFLVAEGEAKLIGTYTLRLPGSASNPPCKLELRADHSLTLSNCPTPGDPQRLVTIPGEWSLSIYRGVGIHFQLSVSGGDAVKKPSLILAAWRMAFSHCPVLIRSQDKSRSAESLFWASSI